MSDRLHHPTRLFLGGRWICSAGDWLGATALGWLIVHELNGGSTAFAVNRLLIVLGVLVSASSVGAMLHRMSAPGVLIMSCGIATLLSSISATLAWLAHSQPPDVVQTMLFGIVLLGVVAGVSQSLREAGEQRIQVLLVPEEDQHKLEQMWSIMFYIGRVVFALVSGICLSAFGAATLFVLDGLSYLILGIATIAVWRMLRERDRELVTEDAASPDPESCGIFAAILHGIRRYALAFRVVWRHPDKLYLLWLVLVIEGIGFTAWTLLPEIISKELGADGFSYGLVIALGGAGGFVGAVVLRLFAHRFRTASKRMFLTGLFLAPLGLVGVALSTQAWKMGAFYGVALCGWTWFLPSIRVYFRLGDHGRLSASVLTFALFGIAKLMQVTVVIICCGGFQLTASTVLLASGSSALLAMFLSVFFGRRMLADCLHRMFKY